VFASGLRARGRAGPRGVGVRPWVGWVRGVFGVLFPAPVGPGPRGWVRWAGLVAVQVVLVAAGGLVMLARVGGRPVWRSVYAEDPGIYLPQALAHPWQVLQSYGGYLQLVPRLIGQGAALVPVKDASVVFAVGGAVVASGCAVFTYHASAGVVGSRWWRVVLGVSVVLLPVAQLEVADNGLNTIWYLLVALFWAALWRPVTRAGVVVAGVVAFAAAASSSLGLLLVPLFAARALVVGRRLREHGATVGWAAGCLLQLGVIATSHVSRLAPHDPLDAVRYYAHEVVLPALGWHLSWHLRTAVGLTAATLLAGVVIFAVLGWAVVTQPGKCRVFILTAVATGLVFTAVTSAFAWGGPGQLLTIHVEHGARYATVPILLLDAALIAAADTYTRRHWPHPRAIAATVALAAVLATGWATDFRYPVRRFAGPASAWHTTATAWLAHCRHHPATPITVAFTNWWGTGPTLITTTFHCTTLHR
jgi:hypothetical protein